jgi:hypothetical protein
MELLPAASGHREALPPQKSLLNIKTIIYILSGKRNTVIDGILLADILAMHFEIFPTFFFFGRNIRLRDSDERFIRHVFCEISGKKLETPSERSYSTKIS